MGRPIAAQQRVPKGCATLAGAMRAQAGSTPSCRHGESNFLPARAREKEFTSDVCKAGEYGASAQLSSGGNAPERSQSRWRYAMIDVSYGQGRPMTNAQYVVVQHGDEWMIKFDNEEYGPYKSKNEAMLFAIDAAQKLGEHGEGAEVLLMGENNHVRPEWVYGRDPYPPRLTGF
jgi:hypothetical protein